MIGCNYWGSKYGTEMWANWDPVSVENDLKLLSGVGVKYMRVFPNWRDFQPVHMMRAWANTPREYRLHGKELPKDEFFLDEDCMAHFAEFLGFAEKYGIRFVVSVVTGWMSGMMFTPPALNGKRLMTDPESLKLQIKFVRGFVRRFRESPVIAAWDLGNECNCMESLSDRNAAYLWTATVSNAIRAEDTSRPIMSGMHALSAMPNDVWNIADQGELTDVLTPHPYPSPTVGGDRDVMTEPRTSYIPTFMCEYYSGIGGKPSMIQEQGTFNDMVGNREKAAQFVRVNLCSGWANGSIGYLWWCGFEQCGLTYPPYSWSMVENELGLFDSGFVPKPVAQEMKRMSAVFDALPDLPPKEIDAVCVFSDGHANFLGEGAMCYVLAKQAGFSVTFRHHTQPLPEAKLYIVPCVTGWAPLYQDSLRTLTERARAGASVLVTNAGGLLTDFEALFGMRSDGMRNNSATRRVDFGGYTLPVRQVKEFLLRETTAEVLARDENGNIIFARNRVGKGWMYFLHFPMEKNLYEAEGWIADHEHYPFRRIYAKAAEELLPQKLARSADPDIGVTIHPADGGTAYVVAVNYTGTDRDPAMTFAPHKSREVLYGAEDRVGADDMTVWKLYL